MLLNVFVALTFTLKASAESPLFLIDSPSLIRSAAEAISREFPDIPEDRLLARDHAAIDLFCYPDQGRLTHESSDTQCPMHKFVPSPCRAEVEFVIRDTVKRDVTALANGRCKLHTLYQSVSVKIYEDDTMEFHRSGFDQKSSSTGSCADIDFEKLYDLDDLIARHKKVLDNEIDRLPIAPQVSEAWGGLQ
ncbi:hypothetical protein [Microbulbifer magnicolonia]|uniref:hypothetical protein n=1 Tax=Microbulbifer magnicolonia TaxID=3109744 RepID=UPI002B403E4B|nr:hypothetical protein [Microbulbifer sp. GG15]